ncbi:MAG: ABC transporter substrate-binding protein [Anaerolineae bacterium]
MSNRETYRLSRRDLLRFGAIGASATILAACQPQVVEKIVKETVEVEKIVETEVEKIVEQTVVVEVEAGPAKAALEGQVGVLWGISYEHHVKAYERCANLFKEQTGAEMKIEPEAGADKFIAALAAGTAPDIECLMGKLLTPLLIRNVVASVDETVFAPMGVDASDKWWWGDSIQAYEWQGKHYGVPLEANNCGQCVNVPVDDLEALGIRDQWPPHLDSDPPVVFFESYEEMWELAKMLQKEEGGEVVKWGLSSKGWDGGSYLGILRSLLADEGTDWYDEATDTFNINTEAGIAAMQMHAETPVKMGIETELDQTHVDAALAGKIALAKGNIGPSSSQGRELGYNYMLAGTPKINGKLPLVAGEGGWGYIMPVEAKNPDVSIAFLQMMCTTPGQVEFSRIYGGSVSPSWAPLAGVFDHYADPTSGSPTVLNGMLNQQYLAPQTSFFGVGYRLTLGECDGAAWAMATEVRSGNMTAAEACAEYQTRCEAKYAQYKEDLANLS